jgi:hypothetical protein
MTENATRLVQEPATPLAIASLVDNSLRPGGSISLAFSDGIVNVTLDRLGDWTITAGLSARSDRLDFLVGSLERIGFFQATENEGTVYLLWTSALNNSQNNRTVAEQTLLRVLKSLQGSTAPSYIT